MILEPGHPFFKDLPGIAVLVGGMWIANLSYWGFNQYIIQRALATIAEATGARPAGWLGSGLQETWNTLDILTEGPPIRELLA